LNADMDDKFKQEWVGFLKARGGLSRVKGVKVSKKVVIEDDDQGVLADQRVCPGNWSKNCINRAVLVGSPINIDSNASIKERRPQYFDPTEGERDSFLPPECM